MRVYVFFGWVTLGVFEAGEMVDEEGLGLFHFFYFPTLSLFR